MSRGLEIYFSNVELGDFLYNQGLMTGLAQEGRGYHNLQVD